MYEILDTTVVAVMTRMLEKPLPWQPAAECWTLVRLAFGVCSVRAVAVKWCATLADMEVDVVCEHLWKVYDSYFVGCFDDMVFVMLAIYLADVGFLRRENSPAFVAFSDASLGSDTDDPVDGLESRGRGIRRRVDFDNDAGPTAGGESSELFGGVGGGNASPDDDQHRGTNQFNFAKNVSREDYRAVFADLSEESAKLTDLLRVEANRWFVENQQAGLVQKSVRQADALSIATR